MSDGTLWRCKPHTDIGKIPPPIVRIDTDYRLLTDALGNRAEYAYDNKKCENRPLDNPHIFI